jgi:hypothetical protein
MEAQVLLTEIEIRGLKLALIFGVPHPAPDEIVSAREKLTGALEAIKDLNGDPRDLTPLGARATDPSTSHKAAILAAPRAGSQRYKALLCLYFHEHRYNGLTYYGIQKLTGIEGVWKRLSELKDGGWIEVVGQRRIANSRTEGDVYRLTTKGREFCERRNLPGNS